MGGTSRLSPKPRTQKRAAGSSVTPARIPAVTARVRFADDARAASLESRKEREIELPNVDRRRLRPSPPLRLPLPLHASA
jgi:hypothetical protein